MVATLEAALHPYIVSTLRIHRVSVLVFYFLDTRGQYRIGLTCFWLRQWRIFLIDLAWTGLFGEQEVSGEVTLPFTGLYQIDVGGRRDFFWRSVWQ